MSTKKLAGKRLTNGRYRVILVLWAVLAVNLGLSTAVYPATFTVNSLGDGDDTAPGNGVCTTAGNVCTLRAAIQEANALTGADTIKFSVTGTITLGSTLPVISDTLTITGSGASLTISGNNAVSVFSVGLGGVGVTLNLQRLTVANGNTIGEGGGLIINNETSTVTINNSTFSGNTASSGGGAIDTVGGTLTITNSTFSGNTAPSGFGGAIKNGWTLTITKSTFSGNSASGGGAISTDVILILEKSTITGNTASNGGGGIAIVGQPVLMTVKEATVADNTPDDIVSF